jgi:hypothetical protein
MVVLYLAKRNRAAAIASALIYIPRSRGGSFLTVSYRATVLTKALVKVINDDDIARPRRGGRGGRRGKEEEEEQTARHYNRRRHYGALLIAIVV